jgi:hypothetical protein
MVASCKVASCKVASCKVASYKVASCKVASCKVASCKVASCKVTSCMGIVMLTCFLSRGRRRKKSYFIMFRVAHVDCARLKQYAHLILGFRGRVFFSLLTE